MASNYDLLEEVPMIRHLFKAFAKDELDWVTFQGTSFTIIMCIFAFLLIVDPIRHRNRPLGRLQELFLPCHSLRPPK